VALEVLKMASKFARRNGRKPIVQGVAYLGLALVADSLGPELNPFCYAGMREWSDPVLALMVATFPPYMARAAKAEIAWRKTLE
jgi:hypothetical protein